MGETHESAIIHARVNVSGLRRDVSKPLKLASTPAIRYPYSKTAAECVILYLFRLLENSLLPSATVDAELHYILHDWKNLN